MNRKYNPFVSLVGLLLAAVIMVLTCAGCEASAAAETEADPGARFICEYVGCGPGLDALYIITDTESGMQYLAWDACRGAAMTALLPGEE